MESDAALGALHTTERALFGTAGPDRTLARAGPVLWDREHGSATEGLADRVIRGADLSGADQVSVRTHSIGVRLGKLSDRRATKLRAYLQLDGELVTAKIWSGDRALAAGRREVEIRRRIADVAAYRTPRLIASGDEGDVLYLVEPVVRGDHPRSGAERLEMCRELAPELVTAYRITTTGHRRVSKALHPDLEARLTSALLDPSLPWPTDLLARSDLLARALALVRRDLRVPVAITHGDLVASNVVRAADGRHHLIDWEHGRTGPAAFDLVKLVLTSGDPEAASAIITHAAAALGGRGRWRATLEQQLALGVAQTLSWSPGARDRAVAAQRGEHFDREHRLRLHWLQRWLLS